MTDRKQWRDDPRSYALELADNLGADAILRAVLSWMSHDDVRGALDANELSPRFDDDDEGNENDD